MLNVLLVLENNHEHNFLTVLGERVVSFLMRTAVDFESMFPCPPGFGVGDGDAVLLFEMILNSLGSKFWV